MVLHFSKPNVRLYKDCKSPAMCIPTYSTEEYNKRFIIKSQINTGRAVNTMFQTLFRLVKARWGGVKERESKGSFLIVLSCRLISK